MPDCAPYLYVVHTYWISEYSNLATRMLEISNFARNEYFEVRLEFYEWHGEHITVYLASKYYARIACCKNIKNF